ncbi:MAG: acetyl-CoA C-acyltransferase [Flavobacteriales bacterium]|nr:acetyl-CoA C-acyltransferase [Flavobacteriales bacterium]|tara:strand:- start:7429 stop:8625 length:1197 start_codon:yes stop_codon:yes gene_type:complete
MSYIIDSVRTAIGNYGGTLKDVRTDDLASVPIKEIIKKTQIDPSHIDDVIIGCANQAGEDNRNVARMALLLAGIPYNVPGETINRLCASGMSSVIHAHRAIKANDGDLFISGGVENMTRGPLVISKASKAFGRDSKMFDSSFGWRFINPLLDKLYGTDSMGITAENLVSKYNISREDQDIFAYNSQMKASLSQSYGIFEQEIVKVVIPQRKKENIIFDKDEFIKPNTSVEILSKLRPAFKKDGSVTAGNSSGLNDGAAAMLLSSEEGLKKFNLKPKAKIISSAVVGVEPKIMGIGPVYASNKALDKAKLNLDDMDVIEINEAFSAQALACIRELKLEDNDTRINPNGGAIALGHPLGMSGTRIIQSATNELIRKNKRYALITMCIGVGQGYATIIEKI